MSSPNWSNVNDDIHRTQRPEGGHGCGQNPNNSQDHRRIIINDAALKSLMGKKANLLNRMMNHMGAVKSEIAHKSEQVMMDHQRIIEKLKYELSVREKKAGQDRTLLSNQRFKLEASTLETSQILQQVYATSHRSAPLIHLLLPDYSWMDAIIEMTRNTSNTANAEQWNQLKADVRRWNVTICEISKRACATPPEQNLTCSLQRRVANNVLTPDSRNIQSQASAVHSSQPPSIPSTSVVAPGNTSSNSVCQGASAQIPYLMESQWARSAKLQKLDRVNPVEFELRELEHRRPSAHLPALNQQQQPGQVPGMCEIVATDFELAEQALFHTLRSHTGFEQAHVIGASSEFCTDYDGFEVLEEQDPLVDQITHASDQHNPEYRSSVASQPTLLKLMAAQRKNSECRTEIFEHETTEVFHLHAGSPVLTTKACDLLGKNSNSIRVIEQDSLFTPSHSHLPDHWRGCGNKSIPNSRINLDHVSNETQCITTKNVRNRCSIPDRSPRRQQNVKQIQKSAGSSGNSCKKTAVDKHNGFA